MTNKPVQFLMSFTWVFILINTYILIDYRYSSYRGDMPGLGIILMFILMIPFLVFYITFFVLRFKALKKYDFIAFIVTITFVALQWLFFTYFIA